MELEASGEHEASREHDGKRDLLVRGAIIAGLAALLVGFLAYRQIAADREQWTALQHQVGFNVKRPRLPLGYTLTDTQVRSNDGGKGPLQVTLTYWSRAALITVTESAVQTQASLIGTADQPVEVRSVTIGGETVQLYFDPGSSVHRLSRTLVTVNSQGITYTVEGQNTSPDETTRIAASLVE